MYHLYTIGHSTHPAEIFINMLNMHSITAVCDVRSSPYSRFNPQYNRETIQKELKKYNIAYVFLGKELGPRRDDETCYINGKVQYDRIAKTDLFLQGISRLKQGMKFYRIALMCAEKDPIACHRTILICRQFRAENISIHHIIEDGSLENNRDSEKRMMKLLKIHELQLFESPEDLVQRAYGIQGEKIAFHVNA
jgi:uncharacterized protein (DUF488 family)